MRRGLAVEDRLLLEACRVEVDSAGAGRAAELIASAPDWHYLLEAAIRHAVAPLLDHGLERIDALVDVEERIPEAFRHNLRVLHEGSRRRSERIYGALGSVTNSLRVSGAEPVALKDVQLAVGVYPEPALRPLGDVDLLIRRDDWDAAARALAALGFLPTAGADAPYTRAYAVGQHFRRPTDDLWIDLQWNVMQREWDLHGDGSFTFDSEGMWQRAMPVDGLDFELRAPVREEMLFHLCLHLEGHRYSELILFCDVAELLRRESDLDWDAVFELGDRYAARSSLRDALVLARALLDAPVPEHVLESLRPLVFHGPLLDPLFGNLTSLHLSLDEIRRTSLPRSSTLAKFERLARRQAVRAMRADAELVELTGRFAELGGALAIFDGDPSPRHFPDATVPAFAPLRLLVLEHDRSLLERVLQDAGYDGRDGAAGLSKRIRLSPKDPVLDGQETDLRVTFDWSHELEPLLARGGKGLTNAAAALRSVRLRLGSRSPDDRSARLDVTVHVLSPDALVAAIAARAGRADDDRLFRACALLHALAWLPDGLCAPGALDKASRYGAAGDVCAGLDVAAALTGALVPSGCEPPRVLEWGRYGPDAERRFPWLRAAYYVALTLFSIPTVAGRLRYLGTTLVAGPDGRPVLPTIAIEAARGGFRTLAHGRSSSREFAYWIDPATSTRLTPLA